MVFNYMYNYSVVQMKIIYRHVKTLFVIQVALISQPTPYRLQRNRKFDTEKFERFGVKYKKVFLPPVSCFDLVCNPITVYYIFLPIFFVKVASWCPKNKLAFLVLIWVICSEEDQISCGTYYIS